MTVPKAANNRNAPKPAQAQNAKPAQREQSQRRKEVAKAEKNRQVADKAEISTAARALAQVVTDEKPSLQLSAQDLQALSGGQTGI